LEDAVQVVISFYRRSDNTRWEVTGSGDNYVFDGDILYFEYGNPAQTGENPRGDRELDEVARRLPDGRWTVREDSKKPYDWFEVGRPGGCVFPTGVSRYD
jgi:hypothetical protein